MKVLFLDIDGPLVLTRSSRDTDSRYSHMNSFDERCVANLNDIWRHTQCEIVVSSDWTLNNFDGRLQLARNVFQHNNVLAPVIGFIRKLSTKQHMAQPTHPRVKIADRSKIGDLEMDRIHEILEWVDTHNPESWVAVDDLMLGQLGMNFVLVDPVDGLGNDEVKEHIIRQLNK